MQTDQGLGYDECAFSSTSYKRYEFLWDFGSKYRCWIERKFSLLVKYRMDISILLIRWENVGEYEELFPKNIFEWRSKNRRTLDKTAI